jgi:hypothetical protein
MYQTATGYITSIQEERFHLETDNGQTYQLDFRQDATVSRSKLRLLSSMNARVAVEYEGTPNLTFGIAKSVKRLRSTN